MLLAARLSAASMATVMVLLPALTRGHRLDHRVARPQPKTCFGCPFTAAERPKRILARTEAHFYGRAAAGHHFSEMSNATFTDPSRRSSGIKIILCTCMILI